MEAYGNIDSKYRFIILAAKRAKQLLKGAKPKIQDKSRNPIRIAQSEVRNGLIEYEIIPTRMDEIPEREERVFVGGGIPDEIGDSESLPGAALADEDLGVVEAGEEAEGEEAGDEDLEEEDDLAKEDKED